MKLRHPALRCLLGLAAGLLLSSTPSSAYARRGFSCSLGLVPLYAIDEKCDYLLSLQLERGAVRRAAAFPRVPVTRPPRVEAQVRPKTVVWGTPPAVFTVSAYSFQVQPLAEEGALACVRTTTSPWEVVAVFRVTPPEGRCPMSVYENWAKLRADLLSSTTKVETSRALMAMWQTLPLYDRNDFLLQELQRWQYALDHDVVVDALVAAASAGEFELIHFHSHLRYLARGGTAADPCKYPKAYLRLLESPQAGAACLADDELHEFFRMSAPRRWPDQCPPQLDREGLVRKWRLVVQANEPDGCRSSYTLGD